MPSITYKTSKDIRAIIFLLIAGVLLAIPFLLYPTLDISVSERVFSPERGFIYGKNPVVLFIYAMVKVVSFGTVAICSLLLASKWLSPRIRFIPSRLITKTYAVPLFILLALILGPGALVHYVPKEVFDRPRPRAIVEFGGDKQYVAPFHIGASGEGKSFVSGHASTGFFFSCLALVATRRRKTLYASGIVLGLIIGAGRILQGGHFLSDVIFAGVLVLMVNHALHWLIFEKILKPKT